MDSRRREPPTCCCYAHRLEHCLGHANIRCTPYESHVHQPVGLAGQRQKLEIGIRCVVQGTVAPNIDKRFRREFHGMCKEDIREGEVHRTRVQILYTSGLGVSLGYMVPEKTRTHDIFTRAADQTLSQCMYIMLGV